MRYSRGTSNYLERITLSDPTHMMSMDDLVTIDVEIIRIDIGCSLEKEFIKFIRMNLLMVLYLTINQVYSCHCCVCSPLT